MAERKSEISMSEERRFPSYEGLDLSLDSQRDQSPIKQRLFPKKKKKKKCTKMFLVLVGREGLGIVQEDSS